MHKKLITPNLNETKHKNVNTTGEISNCCLLCQHSIDIAVNTGKTKYKGVERHRGMMANEHIRIGSNSY